MLDIFSSSLAVDGFSVSLVAESSLGVFTSGSVDGGSEMKKNTGRAQNEL